MNVISGNERDGILLWRLNGSLDNNRISGNRIGTNIEGTEAQPNGNSGILILTSGMNLLIGGLAAGTAGAPQYGSGFGNLISGNRLAGIGVTFTPLIIQGNAIGTNISGTAAIPNSGGGIGLSRTGSEGPLATIGGEQRRLGNLVSGNGDEGIVTSQTAILNNLVGTSRNGVTALPNQADGIQAIRSSLTRNTVAFNGEFGVVITDSTLSRNSIFENKREGLALLSNFEGRPIKGFPGMVIDSAILTVTAPASASLGPAGSRMPVLEIQGRSEEGDIEFFSNLECDRSGFGEGETYLQSEQNDEDGPFLTRIPMPGDTANLLLTATFTPQGGSGTIPGFSPCLIVSIFDPRGDDLPTPGGTISITPPSEVEIQTVSTGFSVPREELPDDLLFVAGTLSFVLEVGTSSILAGSGQATLTLMMDGPLPDSYYNYGPTLDQPEPHLYEFLFDGTTGAEILDDRIVLYFVDGQGGDHDLQTNGTIDTLGGPVLFSKSFFFPFNQTQEGEFVGIAVSNLGDEVSFLEFDRFDADGSQPIGATSITRLSLAADNQLARLSVELLDEAGIEQNNWLQLRVSGSGIGSFFLLGRADLSQLDGSSALSEVHSRLIFSRVFEGSSAYRGQPATTFLNLVNPGSEPAEMNLTLRSEGGGPSPSGSNSMVTRMLPPKGFLYESISQLCDPDTSVARGYVEVEVTSGDGVIGFQLMRLLERSTIIGLNAQAPGDGLESFPAQLATQPGVLFTNVSLVNSADTPRMVPLTALAEDGSTLATPVTRTLSPGEQFG